MNSHYPIRLPSTEPVLTITHPTDSVWVIELHHGADNRLTEHVCANAITPALDHVEAEWRESWRAAQKSGDKDKGGGALVIVGKRGQDKFFSNGFDFPQVLKKPHFIPNTFNPVLARLLGYPIPCIAAINGHVFAAGLMTAMACDFRIMTSGKAWGCMNEVHFGAPFPHSFSAVFREKVASPVTLRKIALEGHRFTAQEMLSAGLVDELVDGGTEAVLKRAIEFAGTIQGNARSGVWGLIKKGLYIRAIEACSENPRQIHSFEEDEVAQRNLSRAKL